MQGWRWNRLCRGWRDIADTVDAGRRRGFVGITLCLLIALMGCEGKIETGDPPGPIDPDPPISECRTPSQEIFQGLAGTCAGCHGPQDSRPFFANLESFERLIAYSSIDPLPGEPVYVVPGQPEESELLRLLQGTSESLSQMPPGQRSYAQILESGDAPGASSLDDIRGWIRDLEVCELPQAPPRVVARRLTPEMIRNELLRQLDLTDAEAQGTGRPLGSPDDSPQRVTNANNGRVRTEAHAAWEALGGPHILDGRRTSNEVSELMAQTLIPLSQAWCSLSVRTKSILFRHGTAQTGSEADAVLVRENIRYLFLHMLGEEVSDDDVRDMFDEVFVPTELDHDTETAWTAVCATFVRDPLWLTY